MGGWAEGFRPRLWVEAGSRVQASPDSRALPHRVPPLPRSVIVGCALGMGKVNPDLVPEATATIDVVVVSARGGGRPATPCTQLALPGAVLPHPQGHNGALHEGQG